MDSFPVRPVRSLPPIRLSGSFPVGLAGSFPVWLTGVVPPCRSGWLIAFDLLATGGGGGGEMGGESEGGIGGYRNDVRF